MLKFLGTLAAGSIIGGIVTVCFMVEPEKSLRGFVVGCVGGVVVVGIMGGVEVGKWLGRKWG